MESYKLKLKGKKHVSLFWLGDIHEGNSNFNVNKFKIAVERIKETAKTREVIVMLGGDQIDAITHIGDKRFNPSEICEKYALRDLKDLPRKQTKYLYELLKPIEQYIKLAHVGNHEEAYIKHNGFDVYDYLCTDLLPDCIKLGYLAMGILSVEVNSFYCTLRICSSHGNGGGGYMPGYPVNNVVALFDKYDADIYMMGHVHKLLVHDKDVLTLDKNAQPVYKTKWYGVGGTFLETIKIGHRNYFEAQKGEFSKIGFLELKIDYAGRGFTHELLAHKM